jgi:hypothetical protein
VPRLISQLHIPQSHICFELIGRSGPLLIVLGGLGQVGEGVRMIVISESLEGGMDWCSKLVTAALPVPTLYLPGVWILDVHWISSIHVLGSVDNNALLWLV